METTDKLSYVRLSEVGQDWVELLRIRSGIRYSEIKAETALALSFSRLTVARHPEACRTVRPARAVQNPRDLQTFTPNFLFPDVVRTRQSGRLKNAAERQNRIKASLGVGPQHGAAL